ncbi:unnamed protein product [Acanthosepion pharaonis]|uniref:Uncharacterized protein n=1 Tax=Acanthosepion pharaonis TaxID=158019 RepID=A0A812CCQ0_ACAPH|nr:unnamed protein product [Sepia pharaonis]
MIYDAVTATSTMKACNWVLSKMDIRALVAGVCRDDEKILTFTSSFIFIPSPPSFLSFPFFFVFFLFPHYFFLRSLPPYSFYFPCLSFVNVPLLLCIIITVVVVFPFPLLFLLIHHLTSLYSFSFLLLLRFDVLFISSFLPFSFCYSVFSFFASPSFVLTVYFVTLCLIIYICSSHYFYHLTGITYSSTLLIVLLHLSSWES